eukprot:scaffold6519_cov156-Ochromonas_danica.AAC.10
MLSAIVQEFLDGHLPSELSSCQRLRRSVNLRNEQPLACRRVVLLEAPILCIGSILSSSVQTNEMAEVEAVVGREAVNAFFLQSLCGDVAGAIVNGRPSKSPRCIVLNLLERKQSFSSVAMLVIESLLHRPSGGGAGGHGGRIVSASKALCKSSYHGPSCHVRVQSVFAGLGHGLQLLLALGLPGEHVSHRPLLAAATLR